MQWGRGIDHELGERFVKMYVSELTIDMGENGKKALEMLFKLGVEKKIIPNVPDIQLV
jgi:1,4-dihydroxy-6-naphthoate synthase